MKKILLVMLTSLLVSCNEQDLSDYIADNILYNLRVSSEQLSASPIDETHTVIINTNTDWSAKTSDDWIVIENETGNTNSKLKFMTKANTTTAEREGKIGIYCFGKHKKDIIVNQGKVDLKIDIDSIFCGSNKSEQHLSFETAGTWTVSSSNEWIKVSQEKGNGNTMLTLTVDEYMSCKERLGYVTITDQSSQDKEIVVKQSGKYLNVDMNYLSFLASGENIESVNIDTDGIIEFSSDSWVTCTEESNSVLKVKVLENNSGNTKNGSLILKMKGVDDFVPIEIIVYQAPTLITASIVDLGLSVKWASFNIGATNEDEIGGHYFYGEGPDFTYKWYNPPYDIVPDCATGTIYDTANSFWGGHWRNPTMSEWRELYNNCAIELVDLQNPQIVELYNEINDKSVTMNIIQAYKFVATNGKYIIIPIAGGGYYYNPVLWDRNGYGTPGIMCWSNIAEYLTATKSLMQIWSLDRGLSESPRYWYNEFCSVRAVWDE